MVEAMLLMPMPMMPNRIVSLVISVSSQIGTTQIVILNLTSAQRRSQRSRVHHASRVAATKRFTTRCAGGTEARRQEEED
jgi:hypothetical protein